MHDQRISLFDVGYTTNTKQKSQHQNKVFFRMAKNKLLEEIGNRLRGVRTATGMTVRAFGQEKHLDPSLISSLENGNKSIYIETLMDLCTKLDLSPTWVLTGIGLKNFSDIPGSIGSRVASLTDDELERLHKLLTQLEAERAKRTTGKGEDTQVAGGGEGRGARKTRKTVGSRS
jgi:transcriptional regulator with XRE-family HTH domain